MIDEKIFKSLQSLPFFSHLSDNEIEKISSNFRIRDYEKGEILQYEYELKNYFYYLLSGEVKLYKVDRLDNEIFLYNLCPNSIITNFSYESFNFECPCFASVEFTKKSSVIYVDNKYFLNLLQNDTKMALEFLRNDYKRVKLLEDTITQKIIFDVTARVAYMLVMNLDKFNNAKKYEIAYELHIQPETLSRVLAKMSRNGLISVDKNKIEVLNEKGLKEIYEQDQIC